MKTRRGATSGGATPSSRSARMWVCLPAAPTRSPKNSKSEIQKLRCTVKPDLISISKSMFLPPHVPDLEKDFTIHYLPPPPERAAFLKSLADKVRFVQTTGTAGCDRSIIDALPK